MTVQMSFNLCGWLVKMLASTSLCLLLCIQIQLQSFQVNDSWSPSRRGLIKPSCASALCRLPPSQMFCIWCLFSHLPPCLQTSSCRVFESSVQLLLTEGKNLSLPTFCLSGGVVSAIKLSLARQTHHHSLRPRNSERKVSHLFSLQLNTIDLPNTKGIFVQPSYVNKSS